jgi:hypothetical protein
MTFDPTDSERIVSDSEKGSTRILVLERRGAADLDFGDAYKSNSWAGTRRHSTGHPPDVGAGESRACRLRLVVRCGPMTHYIDEYRKSRVPDQDINDAANVFCAPPNPRRFEQQIRARMQTT